MHQVLLNIIVIYASDFHDRYRNVLDQYRNNVTQECKYLLVCKNEIRMVFNYRNLKDYEYCHVFIHSLYGKRPETLDRRYFHTPLIL